MLNKKLMSLVLKEEIIDIQEDKENNIVIYKTKENKTKEINLYELAYKCKRYVYEELGYVIDSTFAIFTVVVLRIGNVDVKRFVNAFEYEAVFEALKFAYFMKQDKVMHEGLY